MPDVISLGGCLNQVSMTDPNPPSVTTLQSDVEMSMAQNVKTSPFCVLSQGPDWVKVVVNCVRTAIGVLIIFSQGSDAAIVTVGTVIPLRRMSDGPSRQHFGTE